MLKKFKCIETGAILFIKTKEVANQFSKSDAYEEIVENQVKNNKEKAIKDYTKKELVAFLETLGIEANEDMKKEDLLALIPEE